MSLLEQLLLILLHCLSFFLSDAWSRVVHSNDEFAPVIYANPESQASVRIVEKSPRQETNRFNFKAFKKVDDLNFYYKDILGCDLMPFIESIGNAATSHSFHWVFPGCCDLLPNPGVSKRKHLMKLDEKPPPFSLGNSTEEKEFWQGK